MLCDDVVFVYIYILYIIYIIYYLYIIYIIYIYTYTPETYVGNKHNVGLANDVFLCKRDATSKHQTFWVSKICHVRCPCPPCLLVTYVVYHSFC